ncbi:MAG: hypothetical protein LBB74_02880, partial [Chitinispirillales bacterium]|nr:hypothetical protein [Chitinispirillales bacterium]
GRRNSDGGFNNAGNNGNWWSATENGSGNAYNRNMNYNNDKVNENGYERATASRRGALRTLDAEKPRIPA